MRRSVLRFVASCCALAATAAAAQECALQQPAAPAGKLQVLAQEVARTNPCTTVPGLHAKSLRSVWAVLTASGRTGGKRFETVPPAGTPTGRVLAGATGVPFDLRAVAAEGVQSLELTSRGKLVFRAAGPMQAALAPRERLAPGESYDWVLRTGANAYRGSFELLEADEAAQVQSRLEAVAKSGLNEQMQMLYRAAVFDDAELYSARDEALAALQAPAAR